MLFLVLYSYMLLVDYREHITVTEWFVTAWILTLLMEEVREVRRKSWLEGGGMRDGET